MSKIEWCDRTINPVKGLCPVACPYCYARRMYQNPRYKRLYQSQKISWYPPAWDLVYKLKKPSRIFVGSTFELFLDTLPENWMEYNLLTAKKYPQHTFIFLTKQPYNLPSEFPDNCWVGVSVTNERMYVDAMASLIGEEAKVKFVSFEPLLSHIDKMLLQNTLPCLEWVIIGRQTPISKKTAPEIEWIKEIVDAADKAGIPVFLKNNLRKLLIPYEQSRANVVSLSLPDDVKLCQEYPSPFYTKCCEDIEGKDPCIGCGPVEECQTAPNYLMLRQEFPKVADK